MRLAVHSLAAPGSSRAANVAGGAALAAAGGWLVARLFLGLDFTDEMQYYGEIASLVRTGKFFQDDLFVQQLGYLFVLPFFKLHQLAFPDQSYFILFGRILLLAGYAAVAVLFWRASRSEFSRSQRVCGVATFAAWIPFQIFALGYNSIAYLVVVAGIATWHASGSMSRRRYLTSIAALLSVLTVVYPTAGLAGIALATVDASQRWNVRGAGQLAAATVLFGGFAGLAMLALHGSDFAVDLWAALKFSGAFGTGTAILRPDHVTRLLLFLATTLLLIRRLWERSGAQGPGFARGNGRVVSASIAMAAGAGLLLFVSVISPVADFATISFFVLLAIAAVAGPPPGGSLVKLGIIGLTLGVIVAATSGNGVHNFGIGAAGVLPFLAAHVARLWHPSSAVGPKLAALAAPVPALLLLLNGVLHPYREQRQPLGFAALAGVPAFAGIRTSTAKVAVVEILRNLTEHGALKGKRVLVAGPHPWIYFACGGVPATPMVFMHFSAERDDVYQLMAERLFRTGEPDFIFLTNPLPPAIGKRIQDWAVTSGAPRSIQLPLGLIRQYQHQTGYDFAGQIYLLSRTEP